MAAAAARGDLALVRRASAGVIGKVLMDMAVPDFAASAELTHGGWASPLGDKVVELPHLAPRQIERRMDE